MKTNKNKYLYIITYHRIYEALCAMEMKSIFKTTTTSTYHFTNTDIPLSRSTFLKSRITILYKNKSIDQLEKQMIAHNLAYDNFKIHFIKNDTVPYDMRLSYMRRLGFTIEGDFAIKDASVTFALTKVSGEWIFGILENNEQAWINRKKKPYSYSNAIEVRLAISVLNIAIQNNLNLRLVDPCSGIGTILIEALVMGLNIKGYEISPFVKNNANKNLEHFGFEQISVKKDMLEINETFDVTILDLPYGRYSSITKEAQVAILQKSKQMSTKLVLISMEDMTEDLHQIGYVVKDSCIIEKSNAFKRYVTFAT